ncbi:hypothetical protein AB0C28_56035 [Nonomuraea sp. NPDC048892]
MVSALLPRRLTADLDLGPDLGPGPSPSPSPSPGPGAGAARTTRKAPA